MVVVPVVAAAAATVIVAVDAVGVVAAATMVVAVYNILSSSVGDVLVVLVSVWLALLEERPAASALGQNEGSAIVEQEQTGTAVELAVEHTKPCLYWALLLIR